MKAVFQRLIWQPAQAGLKERGWSQGDWLGSYYSKSWRGSERGLSEDGGSSWTGNQRHRKAMMEKVVTALGMDSVCSLEGKGWSKPGLNSRKEGWRRVSAAGGGVCESAG